MEGVERLDDLLQGIHGDVGNINHQVAKVVKMENKIYKINNIANCFS